MLKWRWSTGEEHYKSPRPIKNNPTYGQGQGQGNGYDSSINAINQSLDESAFTTFDPDLMNINHNNSDIGSMREELDDKISERGYMQQCGVNPFLGQTSYVNDVVTRDIFLKPINTTKGERKSSSVSENM